jgi:hypothetical protein
MSVEKKEQCSGSMGLDQWSDELTHFPEIGG